MAGPSLVSFYPKPILLLYKIINDGNIISDVIDSQINNSCKHDYEIRPSMFSLSMNKIMSCYQDGTWKAMKMCIRFFI